MLARLLGLMSLPLLLALREGTGSYALGPATACSDWSPPCSGPPGPGWSNGTMPRWCCWPSATPRSCRGGRRLRPPPPRPVVICLTVLTGASAPRSARDAHLWGRLVTTRRSGSAR
ncbi:hypothetical protein GXW82_14105 [Streptacidiphilus sp. 4-A2]|nr:hypothetical protein [Streptacidiphilus sp. 4-A2]